MDPVSQGALGAALSQNLIRTNHVAALTWVGCLAGMTPDLDVLITSTHDPLLFLEYHRQFTHSLVFIPVGALVVAAALGGLCRAFRPTLAATLPFSQIYLASLAGYTTHGLLDACTSYGTQLFWPFSDMRIAWNNVSVIDPLFTVPLVTFVVAAVVTKKPTMARLALIWSLGYLLLGVIQHERAVDAATRHATGLGHNPARLTVKPGFGNLVVWKAIYEHNGTYHVSAIRMTSHAQVCGGDRIAKLHLATDLPGLSHTSQQATDIERFRWFSDNYLGFQPDSHSIVDVRYSMVANQVAPLWGIQVVLPAQEPAQASSNTSSGHTNNRHVKWWSDRTLDPARRQAFWALLRGQGCTPLPD